MKSLAIYFFDFCKKIAGNLEIWRFYVTIVEIGLIKSIYRRKTMAEYEVIREMFNLCPGNQMRDIFIEEVELPEGADLEAFVRNKFKAEEELKIERTDKEDGSVVFDVMTASIHQRYTISRF